MNPILEDSETVIIAEVSEECLLDSKKLRAALFGGLDEHISH